MREESNKPRNSREMAVRNQFFTPEYIVRFLTDNSLGRIWYEMTCGKSRIGEEQCLYMVRRPDEVMTERAIKEPTDILSLDPTCGSMHFGIYLYEVYEYIYMDAWDNHPELLQSYREVHTRDTFHREVPRLILEKNIFGCEIDPRALQLAALSLWLRAQKSYAKMGIPANERPLIKRSNLVLAEAMPGNKRLLRGLMEELDVPMQRLITKIWDKMKFVGEAGLLFKMEKEIDAEIDDLRKNWGKVNQYRYATLFSTDEQRAKIEAENATRRALLKNKEGMLTGFTLASSAAAMPTNLRICTDKLGISPKVCNFSIPLGATVNMDGTSIILTVGGLFMAKVYGVEVTDTMLISLVVTIVMLSLGAPGVPGSGLVCLGVVLSTLGVPIEALGLIIGIYPFIDMFNTMSNTTGDVASALIVASSEKLIDKSIYNK